ncbi:chromate transporter-domain-containing protein [Geopyxis carbonaria]|nr:chromate transporter-domain-containing protein [Geopyxis carbonaria]
MATFLTPADAKITTDGATPGTSSSPTPKPSIIEIEPKPSHDSPSPSPQCPVTAEDAADLEDNSMVPRLSLLQIFWLFFYRFGCFAWGGPVAQIALLKDELVLKQQWISLARFQRVFAVYQIVPGPEAAELCMFFGCLAGGRWGGMVAGVAFVLPGFFLMLLASWAYARWGLEEEHVRAGFGALQPAVAAMVLRATHKLAEHTILEKGVLNPYLLIAAVCTALNTALRINIFLSLAFYGIVYTLLFHNQRLISLIFFILQYVGYGIYVALRGVPTPVALGLGIAHNPSLGNLFVLGLVAGCLSFGGAYTAIPFVQVEAVLLGAWLPQDVFMAGLAIGNILPAPLVIFATFVGYQGGLQLGGEGWAVAGAVVITLGMFMPCFLFTVAGHRYLEMLVRNKFCAPFFDGLCGAVIGVIGVVSIDFLKAGVYDQPAGKHNSGGGGAVSAVVYIVVLAALYKFTHKYTAILLVVCAAVAGQFLFVDE